MVALELNRPHAAGPVSAMGRRSLLVLGGAYPGYGFRAVADIRLRAGTMIVRSWRDLGIAVRALRALKRIVSV